MVLFLIRIKKKFTLFGGVSPLRSPCVLLPFVFKILSIYIYIFSVSQKCSIYICSCCLCMHLCMSTCINFNLSMYARKQILIVCIGLYFSCMFVGMGGRGRGGYTSVCHVCGCVWYGVCVCVCM